jgi:hypothetical protein
VEAAVERATIFNVNGFDVDWMKTAYARAARAYSVDRTPTMNYAWKDPLLRILRTMALELGYCNENAWGLPADNSWGLPVGKHWRYTDHRPDLNTKSRPALSAGDEVLPEPPLGSVNLQRDDTINVDTSAPTARGCSSAPSSSPSGASSPMSTDVDTNSGLAQLTVHLTSFTQPGGQDFDFDEVAIQLLHEMRHMATPSFGHGDVNASVLVKATERYLNELEDYEEMYKHPYFIGVSEVVMNRLHSGYDKGRDANYGCLWASWGSAGSPRFPGYPEDTQVGLGSAFPMGVGMGGLVLRGVPQMAAVRPPMPFGEVPDRGTCLLNGVTAVGEEPRPPACTPKRIPEIARPVERCRVAHWAESNPWMKSKMIRSLLAAADAPPGYHGQPWNTLAHYLYVMPFRMQIYRPCVPPQ